MPDARVRQPGGVPHEGSGIEAEDVTRVFQSGRVAALTGVSLSIRAGEYLAIVGPSGCGKSTLLHILSGIDAPTRGVVRVDGAPVVSPRSWTKLRARRIGFVHQMFNLLPALTAAENVEMPMIGIVSDRRARETQARALLRRVGLAARTTHRPAALSGGEQQRVAIARGLANQPTFLLADEPTGNLDSAAAGEVLALLDACRRDDGLALVVATHDPDIAARAERVVSLRDGRVIGDERR